VDDHHDDLAASLRDEITKHLHHAGRIQLAEAVDRITDKATLRAITTEADTLRRNAFDEDKSLEFNSVGVDIVWVRAVEYIFGLDQ
jgi:hypothetical protein